MFTVNSSSTSTDDFIQRFIVIESDVSELCKSNIVDFIVADNGVH